MPFTKSVPPIGASRAELIRFYEGEYTKLELESERVDAALEALEIIGVSAQWFWDDTILGEPAPGFMRSDSNIMSTITQINVNFEDTQGRNIAQVLKTSEILDGDLIGLVNTSGLGAGNYLVNGVVVFQANHIEIPVDTFQGQSGNPTPDDIMALRWEFATHARQKTL